MTQLELFDEIDEEKFAMGLTKHELARVKTNHPESYEWIKQIRNAVREYQAKVNHLKLVYEEKIYRAKHGRGKEHYSLDRWMDSGW